MHALRTEDYLSISAGIDPSEFSITQTAWGTLYTYPAVAVATAETAPLWVVAAMGAVAVGGAIGLVYITVEPIAKATGLAQDYDPSNPFYPGIGPAN